MKNTLLLMICVSLSAWPAAAEDPAPAPSSPSPVAQRLPASRVELVERALGAIQARDTDAYLRLFPSWETMVGLCPESISRPGGPTRETLKATHARRLNKARAEVQASFEVCHERLDFSALTVTERLGGGWSQGMEGCADEVISLDDIVIVASPRPNTGAVAVGVRLSGLISWSDRRFMLVSPPRCEILEPEAPPEPPPLEQD